MSVSGCLKGQGFAAGLKLVNQVILVPIRCPASRSGHNVITHFQQVITRFKIVITSRVFSAFPLLDGHLPFGSDPQPCQNPMEHFPAFA
jgi:hypothetical protein